jgi:hypothetical protein
MYGPCVDEVGGRNMRTERVGLMLPCVIHAAITFNCNKEGDF